MPPTPPRSPTPPVGLPSPFQRPPVRVVGMAAWLIGPVVVAPWLSHASWHACGDLVGPVATPDAPGAPGAPHSA